MAQHKKPADRKPPATKQKTMDQRSFSTAIEGEVAKDEGYKLGKPVTRLIEGANGEPGREVTFEAPKMMAIIMLTNAAENQSDFRAFGTGVDVLLNSIKDDQDRKWLMFRLLNSQDPLDVDDFADCMIACVEAWTGNPIVLPSDSSDT